MKPELKKLLTVPPDKLNEAVKTLFGGKSL